MHTFDSLQPTSPDVAVTVRPATAEDGDALVALLAAAFDQDPLAVWIFPDADGRRRILPGFFRAFYDLYLDADGVITTADLGAVLLSRPSAAPTPPSFGEQLVAVAGEYAPALMTVFELQLAHTPAAPHHYIAFAGVGPGRQRTGAGAALAGDVLGRCDRDGVPVYTETSSPGGQALARQQGFRPAGPEIRLPNGPALQPMWRDPHGCAP